MPRRTFTHFDVGSIVEGYTSGPVTANSTFNLGNIDFGSFSFSGSGSDSNPVGANVSANARYEKTGVIDFTSGVNPVRADSIITRVKVRTPVSVAASMSASLSNAGLVSVSLNVEIGIIAINESETGLSPISRVWSESVLGSDADQIFDFSGNPINLATLQASFGSPILFINLISSGASAQPAPSNNAFASFNIGFSNWEVEVTWTNKYVWSIPQPTVPVSEGDTVTLTSPEPNEVEPGQETVDFEEITQVDILIPDYSIPGTFITINVPLIDWIPITPRLFRFIMPSWAGNQPTVIWVRLISTQFSGSVARQLYTIFFASASGMYELVKDKTSDTLYIEAEPGQTIDVKIPNPFGKTGFFGK